MIVLPFLVMFVVTVVMAVTDYTTFTPDTGYVHVYTEPGWNR